MKNVVAVLFRKNHSLLYKIEYDKFDDSCERIKNKKKTDVNNVNILRLITIDLHKSSHVFKQLSQTVINNTHPFLFSANISSKLEF